MFTTRCASALALGLLLVITSPARAVTFTNSYSDGSSWNTVYAQGFRPSLSPNPDPALAAGDAVYLQQFSFFKSGTADGMANIQLAIINNIFGDLTGLSTSSGLFVGLSNNTIASTAPLALNDAISFSFSDLPLTYGNNYGAVFVNVGGGGVLTPIRVSALTADYVETPPGSGTFLPETNYGTNSQFEYGVSNFITVNQFGQFFNIFGGAADANFLANLVVPEPASLLSGMGGLVLLATRRRVR